MGKSKPISLDETLEQKTKKRHKRQDKDALGDDELEKMGWMEVDDDIMGIFEQLARTPIISAPPAVTPRRQLDIADLRLDSEIKSKKRPREEADSSGGNEAWASIDVNPATLFVGNTESGFMGLEELKPGKLFDGNSVMKKKAAAADGAELGGKKKSAKEKPAAKKKAKKAAAASKEEAAAEAADDAAAADEAPEEEGPEAPAGKKGKKAKDAKEETPLERPSKEALEALPPAERAKVLAAWQKEKRKRETRRRREQRKRQKAEKAAAEKAGGEEGARAASGAAAGPASGAPPAKKAKKDAQGPPAAAAAAAASAGKQTQKQKKKQAAAPPPPALAPDDEEEDDDGASLPGSDDGDGEAAPARPPRPAAAGGPWGALGVSHPLLLGALADRGFTQPTLIQQQALPAAIAEGRDIIGAAETGSGKTLAFGLPILQRLCEEADARPEGRRDRNEEGLRGLILTPTRELAMQVTDHIKEVAGRSSVRVVAIVGGMAPEKQQRLLSRKPELVVATPGRLWELISQGEDHLQTLGGLRFLVLDEADRMVERGHFAELVHILDMVEREANVAKKNGDAAPSLRQTFVFSATLTVPPSLRRKLKLKGASAAASKTGVGTMSGLMEKVPFTRRPTIVDVTDRARVVAAKIVETAVDCTDEERDVVLYYLLKHHAGRTLVFANAISAIRRVSAILTILEVPHQALHGQMQQRQRLKALDRFRSASESGGSCALVATDVAARGIDIEGVRTVIHYQVPPSAEVYVHRSGRTARGGADGLSILISTPAERSRYTSLLKALNRPESMDEFPVDSTALTGARKRLILANKIDKLRHSTSKAKADRNWLQKSAKDLDIELDDDSKKRRGGEGDDGTEEEVSRRKEKQLAAQLRELLSVPLEGPRLVDGRAAPSRKYPTVAGGAQTSKKLARKAVRGGGDALAALRERQAQKAEGKEAAGKKRSAAGGDGGGAPEEEGAEQGGGKRAGKGKQSRGGEAVVKVAASLSAAAAGPGAPAAGGAAAASAGELVVDGAPAQKKASKKNKFKAMEEALKARGAAGRGGA